MRDGRRGGWLAAALLFGCVLDPDATWVLGEYSTAWNGQRNVYHVEHFEFRDDGVVVLGGFTRWGKEELPTEEFAWEPARELVEVRFAEPREGASRWRLRRTEKCDELLLEEFRVGEAKPRERTLYRGKMCLQSFGPCPSGSNCDSNVAEYCDEPPPPCEEPGGS